jgi:branched-chain amino acid transport system ATP-binding protein
MGQPAAVLLVDEPTLGLAPAMIQQVEEIARRCVHAGTAVLLVEQRLEVVRAVASSLHIMVYGEVFPCFTASTPASDGLPVHARCRLLTESTSSPRLGRRRCTAGLPVGRRDGSA